jgi:hypothetical protein
LAADSERCDSGEKVAAAGLAAPACGFASTACAAPDAVSRERSRAGPVPRPDGAPGTAGSRDPAPGVPAPSPLAAPAVETGTVPAGSPPPASALAPPGSDPISGPGAWRLAGVGTAEGASASALTGSRRPLNASWLRLSRKVSGVAASSREETAEGFAADLAARLLEPEAASAAGDFTSPDRLAPGFGAGAIPVALTSGWPAASEGIPVAGSGAAAPVETDCTAGSASDAGGRREDMRRRSALVAGCGGGVEPPGFPDKHGSIPARSSRGSSDARPGCACEPARDSSFGAVAAYPTTGEPGCPAKPGSSDVKPGSACEPGAGSPSHARAPSGA